MLNEITIGGSSTTQETLLEFCITEYICTTLFTCLVDVPLYNAILCVIVQDNYYVGLTVGPNLILRVSLSTLPCTRVTFLPR